MTIEELVVALDDARDDAVVIVGKSLHITYDIRAVETDENGNIVLIFEDREDGEM